MLPDVVVNLHVRRQHAPGGRGGLHASRLPLGALAWRPWAARDLRNTVPSFGTRRLLHEAAAGSAAGDHARRSPRERRLLSLSSGSRQRLTSSTPSAHGGRSTYGGRRHVLPLALLVRHRLPERPRGARWPQAVVGALAVVLLGQRGQAACDGEAEAASTASAGEQRPLRCRLRYPGP
mmetsp:Transcript_134071/g.388049  ORF Transcript_134071/g.388049 Transcript_134071/m.388049 type:complete len:178 (-) Transcript_134071:176-709(-)